jgi:serine/threonine protein kinase
MSFPCPHCDLDTEPGDACGRCKGSLVIGEHPGWRIQRSLGKGGTGHVYEALDAGGARVAVKSIPLVERLDPKALELFEHGSRLLKSLDHPRVPRVHAFVHDERGRAFLVREILDGGTLAERIADDANRVTPAIFEKILIDLLTLLGELHGRVPPIVHRDIKPQNIMFRSADDWDPVLADFDSVALPEAKRSGLTIVGTPGYCAPEQFAGIVSPAADLYSLGATMLFVATHEEPDRLPRVDGRFDVGRQLDALPARVRDAVLHLVEPERSTRTRSADEALRELREAEHDPTPGPAPRPEPPPRRKPARVAQASATAPSSGGGYFGVAVILFILVLSVTIGIASRSGHPSRSFTPDLKCLVETDPPGAAIYRVGLDDDPINARMRENMSVKDAGALAVNMFAPEELHMIVGTAPLRLSREDMQAGAAAFVGTHLQAELEGYQPAPVPQPFEGDRCVMVKVVLTPVAR